MHPELQGAEMPIMMVSGPSSKCQNAKIPKCENSKMQKFENAKIRKFKIRKFAKFNLAIKRLQFHSFEATFGASGAPGRGDSIYDGFGADS